MKRKTDSPTACARHSVDPVTKVEETFADYMKEFAKKGSFHVGSIKGRVAPRVDPRSLCPTREACCLARIGV